MIMAYLEIKDLHVSVEGKKILNGINLRVEDGQVCALMGPNGSGKSTLSNVIMGHPKYKVDKGEIILNGVDILSLPVNERSKLGIYLAFQHPMEIPGVALGHFLYSIYQQKMKSETKDDKSKNIKALSEFKRQLDENLATLSVDKSFLERAINVGLSGGEKKRAEILQMLMLRPKFAVLDETDSGLDVDSLKIVSKGISTLKGPGFGCLLITHYQRILNHIQPDAVYILVNGKIAASGGPELAHEIETKGYANYLPKVAA